MGQTMEELDVMLFWAVFGAQADVYGGNSVNKPLQSEEAWQPTLDPAEHVVRPQALCMRLVPRPKGDKLVLAVKICHQE